MMRKQSRIIHAGRVWIKKNNQVMKTLAIELSTDTGSIALLEGRNIVFERRWEENRDVRQGLFALLVELSGSGELCLADVGGFAAGVGPGSFAGLRMAVSAACGLAAPGNGIVTGILSSEALAWQGFREMDTDEVVVWGDARKTELWAMRFRRGDRWPERMSGLVVGGFGVVPDDLVRGKVAWVTADWHRIGPRLKAICPAGVHLVEKRTIPGAGDVGWLAVEKREAGAATESLLPVYVHPAAVIPETMVPAEKHVPAEGRA